VLPRGGTLVLYTDGLIERRDEVIDVGLASLRRVTGQPDPDLEDFCDRLLLQLGAAGQADDDVAVVALRRA
jgi:serine phosphatase RsbU (regulator of sigma subunit)